MYVDLELNEWPFYRNWNPKNGQNEVHHSSLECERWANKTWKRSCYKFRGQIIKCVGSSFSVFARALHAMAKIGEDLYLSPQSDGLALRAMNSSRSAFASFLFDPVFFSEFDLKSENESEEGNSSDIKCKITMKVSRLFSVRWIKVPLECLKNTIEKLRLASFRNTLRTRMTELRGMECQEKTL